jgi:hypothetical protein
MGRWRRWSLNGIPTVLQKPNLSIPQFLCSSPRFAIPFSHHTQGYFESPESFINDALHCPLPKSCSSWVCQVIFQCPSRPADLALYSMLPFPPSRTAEIDTQSGLHCPMSATWILACPPQWRGCSCPSPPSSFAFDSALNHCSSEYGRLTWPL